MATSTNVNIEVTATDEATKTLWKISKSFDGVKSSISKVSKPLKQLSVWIAWIWAASLVAWKQFVEMANDQIRVEKQLDAVIKSTWSAAWFTAKEIKTMASSLQNVTTIWDEAIIAWQNMLLTFTSIGKDVFPQATETLLDMATAMNNGATPSAEQLSSQAIQLWKALNDPYSWITALTRVGVKFTEQQEKQIKSLSAQGKVMEAQKIILAELAKEFWWQARIQAETFEGKMIQLNNTIWDTKEAIWMALIPVLESLFQKYQPMIIQLTESINLWAGNAENVENLTWKLSTIWEVIFNIAKTFTTFWAILFKTWEIIWIISFHVVNLKNNLRNLASSILWFVLNPLLEAWKWVWDILWQITWLIIVYKDQILWIFTSMWDAITWIFDNIVWTITGAIDWLKSAISSVWNIGSNITSWIWETFSGVTSWIWGAFSSITGWNDETFSTVWNGDNATTEATANNSSVSINLWGVTVQNEADENRLINTIKNELTRTLQLEKKGIS